MTESLIKVECPASRRSHHGVHACRHVLAEVPPSWGPVRVVPLAHYGQQTGDAQLQRCRKCGTWLQVTYGGLALRSA